MGMKSLLNEAIDKGKSISEVTIEFEEKTHGKKRGEIVGEMKRRISVMRQAALKGVSEPISTRSGLVKGNACRYYSSIQGRKHLTGQLTSRAIAYALAVAEVNSSMGLVVAAPT